MVYTVYTVLYTIQYTQTAILKSLGKFKHKIVRNPFVFVFIEIQYDQISIGIIMTGAFDAAGKTGEHRFVGCTIY